MINFKEITLADKDLIQSFTLAGRHRNCNFSFVNLCSWSFLYHTTFAVESGLLLFRFRIVGRLVYMMPVGTGSVLPAMEILIADAEERGDRFCLLGACESMKAELETTMPGRFTFTGNRDYHDYLYLRADLATLKGKKYQPKRNHINKFKKEYPDYEYKELTPALVPECLRLEEAWCRANGCDEGQATADERRSMTYALQHMEALGLVGGVLHVGGQIAAFTYGAPINHDTWDTCVEKADTAVEGSYAMINFEFANHIDEQYTYINREEDLGIEGLRKAKLSYRPAILLEKDIVELHE